MDRFPKLFCFIFGQTRQEVTSSEQISAMQHGVLPNYWSASGNFD